jgi:hypothetical protein
LSDLYLPPPPRSKTGFAPPDAALSQPVSLARPSRVQPKAVADNGGQDQSSENCKYRAMSRPRRGCREQLGHDFASRYCAICNEMEPFMVPARPPRCLGFFEWRSTPPGSPGPRGRACGETGGGAEKISKTRPPGARSIVGRHVLQASGPHWSRARAHASIRATIR